MIPKSLSATALATADACLARYWAENIVHADDFTERTAADLGTAVHGALELFVANAVQSNTYERNFETLYASYCVVWQTVFDVSEIPYKDETFLDGMRMLQKWYDRTNWSQVEEVISCEVKSTFPIKTSIGDIPFNYIWDRCDRLVDPEGSGREIIRVVDYKTIRVPITAEKLHSKIQARCYALAARIAFPQADEIWVQFDLLRHEAVGTRFSKDEDAATWKWLKASAERILAADETNLPALEKLNPECQYCVRKLSCEALGDNVAVGGMGSITGIDEAASILSDLTIQIKANTKLAEQLEAYVLLYAQSEDITEFSTDNADVKISVRSMRKVDPSAVARIVGPEVLAKYGRITVTDIDKLVSHGVLDREQEKAVKALIYKTFGEPTVKLTPRSSLEEE